MVNLLPHTSQSRTITRYYAHLVTVVLVGLAVAGVAGIALLVPTYLLAQGAAQASARYSAALAESVGLKDASKTAEETKALSERIRLMKNLTPLGVTGLLNEIGAHRSAGIRVTEVSAARAGAGETVALSGSAATRAGLLAFVDSLKKSPRVSGLVLPVSDLVTDKDATFSLTFTFTPSP